MEPLYAVRGRLLAAGARISSSPSKLARALGDRVPVPIARSSRRQRGRGAGRHAAPGGQGDHRPGPAGAGRRARRRPPDAGRLPPAARAAGGVPGVLDKDAVQPLRDELRWLGEELGAARDAEVVRDRLRALVASEPPELVLGPVEHRIVDTTRPLPHRPRRAPRRARRRAVQLAARRARRARRPPAARARRGSLGPHRLRGRAAPDVPAGAQTGPRRPRGRGGPRARGAAARGPQGGQACPVRRRGRDGGAREARPGATARP